MQHRQIIRNTLKGTGIVLALMFLAGGSGNGWWLGLGLFALFLGITDFGRQCPLVLSARHLAYRIRSKGKPPASSVKSLEGTGG